MARKASVPATTEAIDIAVNEIELDLKQLAVSMTRFNNRVRSFIAMHSQIATKHQHERVEWAFEEFRRQLEEAGIKV